MKREQWAQYIAEQFGAQEEYLWIKYPDYAVFRRQDNQKWFALLLSIPKSKLGLSGSGMIDILNLKCDPLLVGSLREEKGVYPAYHMNKANWVTIALDGELEAEKIKWLLALSYELTGRKKKCK